MTPDRPLVQRFTLLQNDLGVIRPRLVTAGRVIEGIIALELGRVLDGEAGGFVVSGWRDLSAFDPTSPITDMRLLGAQIGDGEPVDVPVPAGSVRRYDVLALRISVDTACGTDAVGVVLSDGPTLIPGHLTCLIDDEPQGDFGLDATLAFAPRYRRGPCLPALHIVP